MRNDKIAWRHAQSEEIAIYGGWEPTLVIELSAARYIEKSLSTYEILN